MFRHNVSLNARFGVWGAAFCSVVLIWTTSLQAQEPVCKQSVEQLMAMLRSIDPYRPNEDVRGKVHVFGSTSMDAMAHGWTTGFNQFHPKAEVEISAAGSEATFDRLLEEPSGVGMLSRPVREAELAELKQKGLKNPMAFVVAREALGVFVHEGNPAESISGTQLRRVFTMAEAGETPTWKLLGVTGEWADQPIHVVSRTPNSGTQKFLRDFVFAETTLREGESEHVSNAGVLKAIGEDKLAIGICGLRSNHKSVKPLQLMADNAIVPSDDHSILTCQYPLTRPLSIVLDLGRNDENARAGQEFVRYALGQTGQTQAIRVGFYPVDLPLLRAGLQKLEATQLR